MTTSTPTETQPDEALRGQRAAVVLMGGQALIVSSYFLLAFTPYFAHGIPRLDASHTDVEAWDFFPMSYAFIYLMSFFSVLFGPIVAGLFAVCGLILLVRRWTALPWPIRISLLACAAGTTGFIVVAGSDVGIGVKGWVLD